MERLENAIFKQREEINELTTCKAPKKSSDAKDIDEVPGKGNQGRSKRRKHRQEEEEENSRAKKNLQGWFGTRIVSFNEEGLGDQEDASKQGRIARIAADEDLSLINETAQDHGRINDQDIFRVNDLDGDEVVVDVSAIEKEEKSEKVVKKEVSTADPVTTAGEVVTTLDVEVSAALTTITTIDDELTLA
nr:hypothetical protein [Tanacetum cinerariifolium]